MELGRLPGPRAVARLREGVAGDSHLCTPPPVLSSLRPRWGGTTQHGARARARTHFQTSFREGWGPSAAPARRRALAATLGSAQAWVRVHRPRSRGARVQIYADLSNFLSTTLVSISLGYTASSPNCAIFNPSSRRRSRPRGYMYV
eukprot:scaffold707_cov399-Prasinococcus_capsulatus_cf.AAC.13